MKEGWKKKTLGDVCDLQNGFAFKSKSYIDRSNTLNIRMSNIRPDGNFDPDHNIKYLPNSFADKYQQFLLKEGDLIIAMTDMAGDPKILGLPTLVKSLNGRSFLLNQRVGKLNDFTDDIFIPYLRHYCPVKNENHGLTVSVIG
jgi:type I restriction enzyme, S subunit